jgi:hypothetical protein
VNKYLRIQVDRYLAALSKYRTDLAFTAIDLVGMQVRFIARRGGEVPTHFDMHKDELWHGQDEELIARLKLNLADTFQPTKNGTSSLCYR